ncbi:putative protein phosphatase 2C 27 [Hibiscus syriacus]|uniref:PPM-type phosphatase domain-containing protein n=1 Tax=Hibiscus syriacus TaxID=106335 RepID=A0A6A2XUZ4_HIBSY|nr:putative protein phosphatase 2C 27 [Hibiscus syriacus]
MEDTHICIADLAKNFGCDLVNEEAISFYGVGHSWTDAAFAKSCSLESSLASGTTVLTAMIFGRSLLVANAGDSRAVLSGRGTAIEMSKDHRPCCMKERRRIESLGGFIDDGYLNGLLGVTRALGDWHLEVSSDGIWDVFTSQNAIDFTRWRLQDHNIVKLCCKEIVEEAIKRGATDNLTVVVVSFHSESPQPSVRREKYIC